MGAVHGVVKEVFADEREAQFEWRIPDLYALHPGVNISPTVYYFNMKWDLRIKKERSSTKCVQLHRTFPPSGIPASFRFTIGWKTPDGREGDVVRDQTFRKDSEDWLLDIDHWLSRPVLPLEGPLEFTLTCTLRWADSQGPLHRHTPRIPVDAPPRPDVVCLMGIVHGEVKGVFADERAALFEWRIPDFYKLLPGVYRSPTVNYFNMNWHLQIQKKGAGIGGVHLHRAFAPPGIPESFRFTIGWKTTDGEEGDVARDQTFTTDSEDWRLDICYWQSRPTRPRGVTLTCALRWGDSRPARGVSRETQTEDTGFKDISILREHFKNLLLSGDGHDVLLKVQDKQFRAHKNILKVRSPVFEAMFSSDMAESAQDSVTIEDCDADAFGDFLHYVYTGEVDIASAFSALALYYAGDKYDFPRLKDICVEFLKMSFTATTVFDVVSLAARHGEEELMQQAIVFFANNLEEVLLTVEWQRFLLANPILANEINVKAVQCLNTSLCKK